MEDKKIIKLKYPITLKQEDGSKIVYSDISIGRIKNKHLKMLPKNFVESGGKISPDKLTQVIAALAEIPLEVAEEIDFEDTSIIMDAIDHFFEPPQDQTGKSISG